MLNFQSGLFRIVIRQGVECGLFIVGNELFSEMYKYDLENHTLIKKNLVTTETVNAFSCQI